MPLTAVTYHYVRDLAESRYPKLSALDVAKFDGQLDYLTAHYEICGLAQIREAMRGQEPLPRNACVLTFDDGFLDHFNVVFPRLIERGIVGSFFPPVGAVRGRQVLDVHKIHFIVASGVEPKTLTSEILDACHLAQDEYDIPSREQILASNYKASRFDGPEVRFVKNVLQKGLPQPFRSELVASLFKRFVTDNEALFADELYMNEDHLRGMLKAGMDVGEPGTTHGWFGLMASLEQQAEIDATRRFMSDVHDGTLDTWSIAYPYGSYDANTLDHLTRAGCDIGFTIEKSLNDGLSSPLTLGRLDTNHLPTNGAAGISPWTSAVAR